MPHRTPERPRRSAPERVPAGAARAARAARSEAVRHTAPLPSRPVPTAAEEAA
ncbi:hypothetical protein [Streptomyces sp. NPDC093970]|uniref:hypothetical protein n=1 Tax=Streptomyces sp. NPDC093970 TaxID=3155076 RepID=UPI00343BF3E9